MPLQAPISTPIPAHQSAMVDLRPHMTGIGGATKDSLERIQQGFDQFERYLRTPQQVEEFVVTDPSGRMIFWAGSRVVNGVLFRGFWGQEAYIGGTSPANAPLQADVDGRITITLGDADDAAGLVVKDANGVVVAIIGKINTTPDEYGIYAKSAKIGGVDVDNPIIFANSEGLVTIVGGSILIGPGANGEGGVIEVYDATDLIATLGLFDAFASVAVSSTSSGTVTTGAAHGVVANDYVRIAGNSNADHNRVWKVVTAPTSTTYTVAGMLGSGTGGTSTEQAAGGWSKTQRFGGTSPLTANIIIDGPDVFINDVEISITGVDSITGKAFELEITPADISISNLTDNLSMRLSAGYVELFSQLGGLSGGGVINSRGVQIATQSANWGTLYNDAFGIAGYTTSYINGTGSTTIAIDGRTGAASFVSMDLDTPLPVTSGGTGANNAAAARSNLGVVDPDFTDYYTKSQVDSLLLGKANSSHSHVTINISGTSGGGVSDHDHTGTVS